jgi:hypothetical protein
VETQLLTQVRVAAAVQVLPRLLQAVTVQVDLWQFVTRTQTHWRRQQQVHQQLQLLADLEFMLGLVQGVLLSNGTFCTN